MVKQQDRQRSPLALARGRGNPAKSAIQLGASIAPLLILCLGLSSCNITSTPPGPPKVVSTSTIIGDLTEKIGGGEIEHREILQPGADPHVYEPVPADSIAFEQAKLIFYNGYNLEPGLIKIMEAAGVGARKVPVGEVVKPLDMDKEGVKVADPHVWGNVQNVMIMVEKIRDELSKLSPEDAAIFEANAVKILAELKRLDTWVQAQIATIPPQNRKLITTHDAFQYYARAYNLEVTGTLIGISTEEQPSAKTIKNLVEEIKKAKVPAIFAETTINPTLITTVAKEGGVTLAPQKLYSDSIGAPGSNGDSYVKMIVANTEAIVQALGGKITPFPF